MESKKNFIPVPGGVDFYEIGNELFIKIPAKRLFGVRSLLVVQLIRLMVLFFLLPFISILVLDSWYSGPLKVNLDASVFFILALFLLFLLVSILIFQFNWIKIQINPVKTFSIQKRIQSSGPALSPSFYQTHLIKQFYVAPSELSLFEGFTKSLRKKKVSRYDFKVVFHSKKEMNLITGARGLNILMFLEQELEQYLKITDLKHSNEFIQ